MKTFLSYLPRLAAAIVAFSAVVAAAGKLDAQTGAASVVAAVAAWVNWHKGQA